MIQQALSVVNEYLFHAKRELENENNNNNNQYEVVTLSSKERLPSPGKSYSCRKRQQAALHEAARQCELKVLAHAGESIQKELETEDVYIGGIYSEDGEIEENHWIHMIRCGQGENKPKMVLLHGFAASSLSYYKMLAPLCQKYEVFALDLPGMGLSSKPEWKFEGPEPVIDYFVASVEEWRRQVGIEKFTLVGHSLGGYISGNYALQHPDKVEKLVMLSSAGVTHQTKEDIDNHMKNSPLHYQIWFKVFHYIWQSQITFNKAYAENKILPAEFIMRMYMKMQNLPHNEYESWTQYMDKLLLLPESAEKCVYNMLQFPRCNAFLPFEKLFPGRLQVPVHFCYGGAKDWMCSDGAKKLIASGQVKGTYTQFDHFDHQFTFFNPKETCDYILSL